MFADTEKHPQQQFICLESRFQNDFPDSCDHRSALWNTKHSQAKVQTAGTEGEIPFKNIFYKNRRGTILHIMC